MTTELTDSQKQTIRIALAQFEGWHQWMEGYEEGAEERLWVHDDRLGLVKEEELPNYLTSLDSCHEIELKLTKEQREDFLTELNRVLGFKWIFGMVSSTAEQRSLAIYRALNLGELGD